MEEQGINQLTLRHYMCTLRAFLKWPASIEEVPSELYDKVMVPQVGHTKRRSEDMLEAETAEEILEYLSRYQDASRNHPSIVLLLETGFRIGAAMSIDLEDLHLVDGHIDLVHRPDAGTTLKNGKSGERPVEIPGGFAEFIEASIYTRRKDKVDDYGREPLITSKFGRLTRQSPRRPVYKTSAPYLRGELCQECIESPTSPAQKRGVRTRFGAGLSHTARRRTNL